MAEKYYQTELLDLSRKEDYRLIVDLLFHCQNPASIGLKYCFYEEFGPKEKFEEVKRAINLEKKLL